MEVELKKYLDAVRLKDLLGHTARSLHQELERTRSCGHAVDLAEGLEGTIVSRSDIR